MKKKLLFVITQFYKGGAEVSLLNLLKSLSPQEYDIDFLIFDQVFLPNATSLIPEIPNWINVCNASKKEGYFAIIFKIMAKVYTKFTKHQLYRRSAYKFIKDKSYDIAFSYGEWLSPEFIAKKVNAKQKMIWIHTDVDKASYVNPKILFGYDTYYSKYIFVSKNSLNSALKHFPSLKKEKTYLIHNICDRENIIALSKEKIAWNYTNPVFVSVGNLRDEKNYFRYIEVMHRLKLDGIDITWLIIGSTANTILYKKLLKLVEEYHLENNFLFLGT